MDVSIQDREVEMPAPSTIVTLVDEDGDEFPVRLPGVYRENRASDYDAALQILGEDTEQHPNGELRLGTIEYLNERPWTPPTEWKGPDVNVPLSDSVLEETAQFFATEGEWPIGQARWMVASRRS